LDNLAILEMQRSFFSRNRAGCAFAAYAAKRPSKYGWRSVVLVPTVDKIAHELAGAIADPGVQALSLIFPDIQSTSDLIELVGTCLETGLFLDEATDTESARLVRLRAKVCSDLSWVTGFGPFEFLPKTRQAPFVELSIRVKPRPNYDWHFKPPVDGIIHLADLDMKGLSEKNLWKLWGASFETTKKILGHPPDEESAAKTTFAIPFSEL